MTALTYEPITTTTANHHAQVQRTNSPGASGKRVQCPDCEKLYFAAAVVTGKPEWSEFHQCMQVLRRCYCNHCHHIISWLEASDGRGRPTGLLLSSPGITTGDDHIAKFLAKHPEATGVDHV